MMVRTGAHVEWGRFIVGLWINGRKDWKGPALTVFVGPFSFTVYRDSGVDGCAD